MDAQLSDTVVAELHETKVHGEIIMSQEIFSVGMNL